MIKLDTYDRLHLKDIRHRYQPFQEAMVQPLRDWKDGKFEALEVGIGTGNTADQFFTAFPSVVLTAIDLDPEALKISAQKLRRWSQRLHLIEADFFRCSPPPQFDVVYSALTFHNFPPDQQLAFLERASRFLRPGGLYVGCEFMLHESDADNKRQWQDDYKLLRDTLTGDDYRFWYNHHREVHEPNLCPISWYRNRLDGVGFGDFRVLLRENFYCTFTASKLA